MKIKGLKEIINLHLGNLLYNLKPKIVFDVIREILNYLFSQNLKQLEISNKKYFFFGPSILLNFDHLNSLNEISKLIRSMLFYLS